MRGTAFGITFRSGIRANAEEAGFFFAFRGADTTRIAAFCGCISDTHLSTFALVLAIRFGIDAGSVDAVGRCNTSRGASGIMTHAIDADRRIDAICTCGIRIDATVVETNLIILTGRITRFNLIDAGSFNTLLIFIAFGIAGIRIDAFTIDANQPNSTCRIAIKHAGNAGIICADSRTGARRTAGSVVNACSGNADFAVFTFR